MERTCRASWTASSQTFQKPAALPWWWLKIACASGFLVSIVYICFTIIPIISVESRLTFALKIVATVVLANAVGVSIYALGKRKS